MKKQNFRKALVWNVIIITLLSNTVFAMYDPVMMRFTSRDPVIGRKQEPLTLHKYLYCANEPISRIDPTGRSMASILVEPIMAGYSVHGFATSVAATGVAQMNWNILSFGIALERTILPVMALSVVMRKGDTKKLKDYYNSIDTGYSTNMAGGPDGGGPGGWGKWAVIAGGVALLVAQIQGCDEVLRGFKEFTDFYNDTWNDENPQFENVP
ncbi:MAG: hypothetical protein ISS71_05985 [Phycisphaerae bacterium]|nr:hypothetical protein [Phycisphaerae bacterium]